MAKDLDTHSISKEWELDYAYIQKVFTLMTDETEKTVLEIAEILISKN